MAHIGKLFWVSAESGEDHLITEAGTLVGAAGMQKLDEQLYVLDLGINSRGLRLVS